MFATPTVYMDVDKVAEKTAQPPAATTSAASTQTPQDNHSQDKHSQDKQAASSVSTWAKALLRANPMTGLIGFFRAATLGGRLPWKELGYSVLIIMVVFVGGILYFRRVETRFADII